MFFNKDKKQILMGHIRKNTFSSFNNFLEVSFTLATSKSVVHKMYVLYIV